MSTATGYRIAEVARRTGFSPPTLRYYEDVGIMPAPRRTDAGYRVYDDQAVERLAFIARAKQLGCSLDEIGGLLEAREADECEPVKHRLRSLVATKLAAARARMDELGRPAASLEASAVALAGRPVDGPCDDECGCTQVPLTGVEAPGATGGGGAGGLAASADGGAGSPGMSGASGGGADGGAQFGDLPLTEAAGWEVGTDRGPHRSAQTEEPVPAIACSLGAQALEARLDEWREVLTHVRDRSAVPGGLRLTFGPAAPVSDLVPLMDAEHDCCRFFSFALTVDGRGVALEVTVPAGAEEELAAVFGTPE